LFIPSRRLSGVLFDLLFPQCCVGCQREGELLCCACSSAAPRLQPPLCQHCGLPMANGSSLCRDCCTHPLKLDGLRSVFYFEGVIRQSVHDLKYSNLRALAMPLAQLMGEYLETVPFPGEILVPVPLHRRRLKERGYNQSALLAHELGRLVNLPVLEGSLVRLRDTPPQARTTSAEERRRNMADAFTCADLRLKEKEVILIDDVATTGATLEAAAEALRKAGTSSVWALTLAREI
jgi:ComF family protein